jgi:uncharacterized membrane protein YhiD involved in acid resistance
MIEKFLDFEVMVVLGRVGLLLLLSSLLSMVYVWVGRSLSNRRRLAVIFPIMALITMLVISIIKASLTLSLGLVGALSIVRFRSAIKDPEELAYIFLSITLGLGFGAGQVGLTSVFFGLILVVMVVQALLTGKMKNSWLEKRMIHVEMEFSREQKMTQVINILEEQCLEVKLSRISDDKKQLMLFLVKPKTKESLELIKEGCRALDKRVVLNFFEYQALV